MSAIKVCGCGLRYSIEEWRKLKLVYDGHLDESFISSGIELRDCGSCKSTLGLLVPGMPVVQRSTGRRGYVAPWVEDEWSERGYARVIWEERSRSVDRFKAVGSIGDIIDVMSIDVTTHRVGRRRD